MNSIVLKGLEYKKELLYQNDCFREDFISHQKNKFNLEYLFHEVLIDNGWHGDESLDSNNKELDRKYPYKKYVRYLELDNETDLAEFLTIEIIDNEATITSIGGIEKNILCEDAFACYVELRHNGNIINAAIEISNSFEDDLVAPSSSIPVKALPVFIAPYGLSSIPFRFQSLIADVNNTEKKWSYFKGNANHGFNKGIILGYVNHKEMLCDIFYNGDAHLVTFGKTRSGKGAAVQIPAILQYEGSMIIIDPKSELADITAKYRRDVLKQNVVILSPFPKLSDTLTSEGFVTSRFNPLEALDIDDINFLDQVSCISESLIIQNSKETIWASGAKIIIDCLIIYTYLTKTKEEKNLLTVRKLLTQGQRELVSLFYMISKSDTFPQYLRNKVSILLDKNEKGVGSYISNCINQIDFLDNPIFETTLSDNDINVIDLKNPDKRTTIYLVVPPSKMARYNRWLRLFISISLEKLMSCLKKRHSQNILFLIDECASLKYFPLLENAMPIAAGYGIQFWLFFQDFSQFHNLYKEGAYSILANMDVKQYFTAGDEITANHMFNQIGSDFEIPTNLNKSLKVNNFQDFYNLNQNMQMLVFANTQLPFFAYKDYYFSNERYKNMIGNKPLL